MKNVIVLILTLCVLGCGSAKKPQQTSKPKTTKPKTTKPKSKPKPPAKSYADIPEALAALCKAAEDGDSDERKNAHEWLAGKGAAAVAPLGEIVADETASLESRVASSLVLAYLGQKGQPAVQYFLKALESKSRQIQ